MSEPKATAAYAVMCYDPHGDGEWCIAVYKDKTAADQRVDRLRGELKPGVSTVAAERYFYADEVDFFEGEP